MSIFNLTADQIPDPPLVRDILVVRTPKPAPILLAEDWPHPPTEAERLDELIDFLSEDFRTYCEVRIAHREWNGRVDLIAVPRAAEFANDVVLAFEVKADRFDVERALKQSADYVGCKVFEGPHCDRHISACFLYPTRCDDGYAGMFQLIAQWRVGRGYVRRRNLWLAIGQEMIWDSGRGWHEVRANRMLLGKRLVGGSRREFNHGHVELSDWRRF
jgi:hypothetical protein